MQDFSIKPGAFVHYTPGHGTKENGRVKSINGDTAFVVFHCAGEWDNYKDYTGQSTKMEDLHYGWVDDKGHILPEYCDHYYIPTNAKYKPATQRQCQFCGDTID